MTKKWGILTWLALIASVMAVSCSALGSIMINEVELNSTAGADRWVELYNDGDEAVDLSDWTVVLTDGPWVGPMTIPSGATIDPEGYYVVVVDSRWEERQNATATLTDSSGNTVDETPQLSDMSGNDFSQSRIPNGRDTNTSADWAFVMSSKGKANGGSIVSS